MRLTKELIEKVSGVTGVDPDISCSSLGFTNSVVPDSLSFIDDPQFLNELNENRSIIAVFVSSDLKDKVHGKKLIVCDDPRYYFFVLLNHIGKSEYRKRESRISHSASIHPTAFVSEFNVEVGDGTIVGPNVSLLSDVRIGNNCIIQAGTVIGCEGFEYKRTSKGVLAVFHDGEVIIHNNVEIGANTCIDKGFSFRQTIIDDDVKIDNLVHIAHGVQIGKRSFIIATSMLAGSVTIKEDVWIGPNASIAPGLTIDNRGFVTLGSVATRNVSESEWVTGNFAIPHKKFLTNLKTSLK